MVQYAMFLHRNATYQFYPYFEIIYFAELVTLLIDLLLSPTLAWITWNAQPLHRNLRFSINYCFFHLFLLNASRIPLLWAQQYIDDFKDYKCLLLVSSFIRIEAYAFYPWIILLITIERFVATEYWNWYEKQERSTFLIVLFLVPFEAIGIITTYQIIFHESLYRPETATILLICSVTAAAVLISMGFMTYCYLLYHNHRELRKLQRRADPDFDKYSLSRTYQLRENVLIMKMLVKILAPAFIFASPIFILKGLSFFFSDIPRYDFYCNILNAIIDLWIALSGLNVQLIFPFFDHRFRQPATRIAIFKYAIERYGMQTSTGGFARKHLSGNQIQTADHYFNWLEKDLKEVK